MRGDPYADSWGGRDARGTRVFVSRSKLSCLRELEDGVSSVVEMTVASNLFKLFDSLELE